MNSFMNENKTLKALHSVVDDWEFIEIILFILFIPISLVYLGIRVFQEIE